MNARDWLRDASRSVEDARWMLVDAGVTRLDEPLEPALNSKLDAWLARREAGEPLAYITGVAAFYGLELRVNPHVLIPRQDTEVLCEAAIAHVRPGARVLDLCTGSGALAIAIKIRCPQALVTATDISPDALAVARANAKRLGADVDFCCGDLFGAVSGERFDVILSNPPYINDLDMRSLQREVTHEPQLALRGGEDGLDFYRRIAASLPAALTPTGVALLEVGYDQAQAVSGLLRQALPDGIVAITKDLSGIDRVVSIAIPATH